MCLFICDHHKLIVVTEPLFGIDLESQFTANKQGVAPDILVICTQEIERRFKENSECLLFYVIMISNSLLLLNLFADI